MKKLFTAILLLVLIVSTFTFSVLKIMSLGPSSNYFNSKLRPQLDKSILARKILSLHNDGDGRFDLLGDKTKSILLEVVAMQSLNVDAKVSYDLADKIQQITGKKTSVIFDPPIPYQDSVSSKDVDQIAAGQKYHSGDGEAVLYIMMLSSKSGDDKNIGLTHNEDGVIGYIDAIHKFVPNNNKLANMYLYSTLLHEVGHQFGLAHNEEPNCLMNPEAEISPSASYDLNNIVLDFCDYEKGLIKANSK